MQAQDTAKSHADLVQLVGDAIHGTYVPLPLANSTASLLEWATVPVELASLGFTGVSVIVDDILRDISNGTSESKTSSRWAELISRPAYPIGELNLTAGIDHFVRLAVSLLSHVDWSELTPHSTLPMAHP